MERQRCCKYGRQRGEEGMTLMEILVAMPIALLALGLVLTLIIVTTNVEGDGVALGRANANVDDALNSIKRDVANANVIFNPATEGVRAGSTIKPGFSLRMLTVVGGRTMCVQWRVKGGALQDRSWPVGATTMTVPWVTRFAGVFNQQTSPPFYMTGTSPYGNRIVNVRIAMTASTATLASTSEIQSSFSASDAQFFHASTTQFCTPTPST